MHRPKSSLRSSFPLLALVLLAACGGSDRRSESFVVRNTTGSLRRPGVGEDPPALAVVGSWLLYLASEAETETSAAPATPTDLNGDGDTEDEVVVATNIVDRFEIVPAWGTRTGLAVLDATVVGADFYFVVDESVAPGTSADGFDWNGDGTADDHVLLHYPSATDEVEYVDTLDPNADVPFVAAGGRLFYSRDVTAMDPPACASFASPTVPLRMLATTDPVCSTPVEVGGASMGAIPFLLEARGDLVLLRIDETGDADRNGDGLADDTHVLALMDAGATTPEVFDTALAMDPADFPIASEAVGDDWLVAFLVSETHQGGASLGDDPGVCAPVVDATDRVLHFLTFGATPSSITNTGLAATGRIVIESGFIATLSDEADANCDLNQDGDGTDVCVRYVEAVSPPVPATNADQIYAIATGVSGGSMGLSTLLGRFVAVVSEAGEALREIDGKADENDLVAWLDPLAASAAWEFEHQDPSRPSVGTGVYEDTNNDGIGDPASGASEPYAGATFLAAEPFEGRLPVDFLESVPGSNPKVPSLNTNVACGFVRKDNDLVDAVPVWLDFGGGVLDFDGIGYALDPANPTVEVAGFNAFFLASETADGFDIDGDGVVGPTSAKVLLMRNPFFSCGPAIVSVGSKIPGALLATDRVVGAAFYADETIGGADLNGDGDANDLVVRYFRF